MDPKEKPHKFVVRLPLRLRDQIADAATYYRRSMNSEIVARLEHTFSANGFESYWLQSISLTYARAQAESIMVWVGRNAPLCADSDPNTPF